VRIARAARPQTITHLVAGDAVGVTVAGAGHGIVAVGRTGGIEQGRERAAAGNLADRADAEQRGGVGAPGQGIVLEIPDVCRFANGGEHGGGDGRVERGSIERNQITGRFRESGACGPRRVRQGNLDLRLNNL
jgi:hypothetical protein